MKRSVFYPNILLEMALSKVDHGADSVARKVCHFKDTVWSSNIFTIVVQ